MDTPLYCRLSQRRAKNMKDFATKCTKNGSKKNSSMKFLPPKARTQKKALDLPPGKYKCQRFAGSTFRNSPRTVLFLLPVGDRGEQTTDVETPTYGYFLQREVEALGVSGLSSKGAPHCYAGLDKRGRDRKKGRPAWLGWPIKDQIDTTRRYCQSRPQLCREGDRKQHFHQKPQRRVARVPTFSILSLSPCRYQQQRGPSVRLPTLRHICTKRLNPCNKVFPPAGRIYFCIIGTGRKENVVRVRFLVSSF